MSSIPTSPTSPSHKRRSLRLSSFDVLQDMGASPYTSGTTTGTNFSRRSSRTSQTSFLQSPVTPRPYSARSSRPPSFYDRRKSSGRLSISSNISLEAQDNGLGNLADELEDALEDEYEVNESNFVDELRQDSAGPRVYPVQSHDETSTFVDSLSQSPTTTHGLLRMSPQNSPSRPKSEKRRSRHQKAGSMHSGHDSGMVSEEEDNDILPSLARRMVDIETLARTSLTVEDTLSEGGGVVKRTTDALKDLGSQAVVEANLTRIISAYTSMSSHRTHKTKDLFSQAHSLLYGSIFGLPEDAIDAILSELEMLSSTVADPQQQNPLLPLQILASQTIELAHTLRSLTDTLQESRIQANTAARKLNNVKDMVDDMCTEHELLETSMMLIQAGDWDRRCRERQAAATCREVVLGFGDRWNLEVDDRPWTREREGVVS